MANRFNTPIASSAISTYAPVRFDVYQNELNMVQKRWDENEAFSEELKKTINALPAMPGDVPYRDKLVSSLTTKLSDLVSKTTDLGSPSFKREAETIYNQFSKDANVKTLVSNSAQYEKRVKLIEDLNKDNRYRPELDVNNEKTRVDQNGNVIPFVSNVERSYSDPEYSSTYQKFIDQVKASAQSGKGFAFDADGNKINFEFSSEGISPQQIQGLARQYVPSLLRTDVGKQRFKLYKARTGDDQKALNMMIDDIYSYGVGNVFSKTSKGEDFSYAPDRIAKQKEEAQKQYMNPQGMYMETPGYKTENPVLTEDSPEVQEAAKAIAKGKGVQITDIDIKGLTKSLNDRRIGYGPSGVVMPLKKQQFDAVETILFGQDKNSTKFLTGETKILKNSKLVGMDNETRQDFLEGKYKFSFTGIEVNNQETAGSIVVQAIPKDGQEGEQVTLYLPNSSVSTADAAYAKQMLGILAKSKLGAPVTSIPIGGMLPGSSGTLMQVPPNARLEISLVADTEGKKIVRTRQVTHVVVDEVQPDGKTIVRKVEVPQGMLQTYYSNKLLEPFINQGKEE